MLIDYKDNLKITSFFSSFFFKKDFFFFHDMRKTKEKH